MKRLRSRIPRSGTVLGVIAIVIALAGTAVASHLRLGDFNQSSRDRLAGTGVIQYASQAHNTGDVSAGDLKTFTVTCELKKKATAGGFKWTGATPPPADAVELLDAYPNGSGYVVRIRVTDIATADNQPLSVFANCVKSRKQRGTPPA